MLEKLEDIVYKALVEHPKLREDDFFLYGATIKMMGVDTNLPIRELLHNHLVYKLPSFESVSRARRKVQGEHPELVVEKSKVVREEQKKVIKKWLGVG